MNDKALAQLRDMISRLPEWKREEATLLLANPAIITAEQVLRLRETKDSAPLHEMQAKEQVAFLAEMAWRACNPKIS